MSEDAYVRAPASQKVNMTTWTSTTHDQNRHRLSFVLDINR
jgi:hypothetical protein